MKSIAFACSGEGRGHVSRVLALSDFFDHSFNLSFWCPHTVAPLLRQKYPDGDINEVPFLELKKQNHQIHYPDTLAANSRYLFQAPRIIQALSEAFQARRVTALISDFEPFTVHAATQAGIPALNLNHPGIVLKHLSLRPEALAAQTVAQLMMPPARENLICSFYDGDLGPILRKELRKISSVRGDFFVVYTKEDSRMRMMKALEPYLSLSFQYFPDKSRNFDDALGKCRGVIAPGGHQILSEALALGKPVLAFPQKGQYEQLLNARMLVQSGWGLQGDIDNPEEGLRRFFSEIDSFPHQAREPRRFNLKDSTEEAAARLKDFIEGAQADPGIAKRYQFNYFTSILPEKMKQFWGTPA